jgi:hypothetical protein
MDNSSKPNQTRTKGSLPDKNTTSKKELLTLSFWGKLQKGVDEVGEDDDE